MGIRRGENFRIHHSGKIDISGENGLAAHPVISVLSGKHVALNALIRFRYFPSPRLVICHIPPSLEVLRGFQYRNRMPLIGTATAKISAKGISYLSFGRFFIPIQQRLGCTYKTRCAVAALESIVVYISLDN